ncbi:putative ATP/GTP-binding protein [Carbonactinospora thermoautotrophica]|uniref:Putative ATP/GTP-binding protein n=2 Tax=Carbonactinospora thermoautotrophica TaxID=1469144 RepID=A0A132MHC7_9ACTN|nr:AAA family ATPase [Carbonactinospora thermoautotrophica]KWW97252.1 putative ATP/GTP-binding protein [Carbonactinospora thermoautotrophica]
MVGERLVQGRELAPRRWQDLRGTADGHVEVLRYPRGVVLVVAGVPGAGKSTLLHRLFPISGAEQAPVWLPGDVLVVDSEQARNRWRQHLGPRVPYRLYRPLVHLTNLWSTLRALRRGATVVLHDCGTRRWWRHLVTRAARRPVHVILLDVPPELALAGQRARNRLVRGRAFRRHLRAWRRLVPDPEAAAPPRSVSSCASCLVLDRAAAARLRAISFS